MDEEKCWLKFPGLWFDLADVTALGKYYQHNHDKWTEPAELLLQMLTARVRCGEVWSLRQKHARLLQRRVVLILLKRELMWMMKIWWGISCDRDSVQCTPASSLNHCHSPTELEQWGKNLKFYLRKWSHYGNINNDRIESHSAILKYLPQATPPSLALGFMPIKK